MNVYYGLWVAAFEEEEQPVKRRNNQWPSFSCSSPYLAAPHFHSGALPLRAAAPG